MENRTSPDGTLIGPYGQWAASLIAKTPSLSFRRDEFYDPDEWRKIASERLLARMAIPDIGPQPPVNVVRRYSFDGLDIEELTWQLPYGRPTEAVLLKPQNTREPLPGILAFHDHAVNKYFGTRKITRTPDQTPLMVEHQRTYYEGRAWANEIAKRGYVVLVADAFPFASRRVWLQDVPEHLRQDLTDEDHDLPDRIQAYNDWAAGHEHIMAKSLFSAGTTWPGVFFAEDRIALDILCTRTDVDATRIGCAGLSGGGMRTMFMGGLDSRIKCAVCVGFMTTWQDLIINRSYTHTWMVYVPILPNELDLPEILGLRVPLPAFVQNNDDDPLFTTHGMRTADTILRNVYRKAGAEDRYACAFYPGEHKFDIRMQDEAFAWFDRWLKV